MKNNKLSEQQIKAVLVAFHEALDHGPWASSALLRVLGKKLQGLSDKFVSEVGLCFGGGTSPVVCGAWASCVRRPGGDLHFVGELRSLGPPTEPNSLKNTKNKQKKSRGRPGRVP